MRHSQTISYSCNCTLRKREKIKNGTTAMCEETTDDTFTKVREEINLEIQEIWGILRRKTQKKTTSRHTSCLAQTAEIKEIEKILKVATGEEKNI